MPRPTPVKARDVPLGEERVLAESAFPLEVVVVVHGAVVVVVGELVVVVDVDVVVGEVVDVVDVVEVVDEVDVVDVDEVLEVEDVEVDDVLDVDDVDDDVLDVDAPDVEVVEDGVVVDVDGPVVVELHWGRVVEVVEDGWVVDVDVHAVVVVDDGVVEVVVEVLDVDDVDDVDVEEVEVEVELDGVDVVVDEHVGLVVLVVLEVSTNAAPAGSAVDPERARSPGTRRPAQSPAVTHRHVFCPVTSRHHISNGDLHGTLPFGPNRPVSRKQRGDELFATARRLVRVRKSPAHGHVSPKVAFASGHFSKFRKLYGMRVAIVGATGQVGVVLRSILAERAFPVEEMRYLASGRSAGTTLPWAGVDVVVEDAEKADLSGIDLALCSAPASVSRWLAPRLADAGAIVIDNSSAWRMDPDVPLVVPEANVEALSSIRKGIVANPNCTTMVAIPVLKPLHDAAGLKRILVSTYQAVSGGGVEAVRELSEQLMKTADHATQLTFDGGAVDYPPSTVFSAPIAHNILPLQYAIVDDGSLETEEEQKFRNECRKILGLPDLALTCTCVRVPVFTGHSASIVAEFERDMSPELATAVLEGSPGVELAEMPTPLMAAGGDVSYVGRIRRAQGAPNALAFFVAGDNLRKGAALNVVQIAEALRTRV
jgi:aspartate-semialdehyde dehydrogenase